jgi:hypothetical protein
MGKKVEDLLAEIDVLYTDFMEEAGAKTKAAHRRARVKITPLIKAIRQYRPVSLEEDTNGSNK